MSPTVYALLLAAWIASACDETQDRAYLADQSAFPSYHHLCTMRETPYRIYWALYWHDGEHCCETWRYETFPSVNGVCRRWQHIEVPPK